VSEQDRLKDRFTTFRRYSIETTTPPGVAAIQRAVFQRRARKAGLVAVIAAALVLSMVWPVWSHRPIDPAITPSPSGTVSSTASGSAAPAPPPPQSAQAGPGSSGSGSPSPQCVLDARGHGSPISPFVGTSGSTWSVSPADYFVRCPNIKLRVYVASYHWDLLREQYVLYRSAQAIFTAAQPKVNALTPVLPPDMTCGYAWYSIVSNRPIPQSIPRSVQDGTERDQFMFTYAEGSIIGGLWALTPSAKLKQFPDCVWPGPASSPS
jgi:hypothetical protein